MSEESPRQAAHMDETVVAQGAVFHGTLGPMIQVPIVQQEEGSHALDEEEWDPSAVAAYLADFRVLERVNDSINDAVRNRAPNPLLHMASVLRSQHGPSQPNMLRAAVGGTFDLNSERATDQSPAGQPGASASGAGHSRSYRALENGIGSERVWIHPDDQWQVEGQEGRTANAGAGALSMWPNDGHPAGGSSEHAAMNGKPASSRGMQVGKKGCASGSSSSGRLSVASTVAHMHSVLIY